MALHSHARSGQITHIVPQVLTDARAYFFAAALFSLLLSVALFFTGDREQGIYVGIWVPSILSAGNFILGGRRNV